MGDAQAPRNAPIVLQTAGSVEQNRSQMEHHVMSILNVRASTAEMVCA